MSLFPLRKRNLQISPISDMLLVSLHKASARSSSVKQLYWWLSTSTDNNIANAHFIFFEFGSRSIVVLLLSFKIITIYKRLTANTE